MSPDDINIEINIWLENNSASLWELFSPGKTPINNKEKEQTSQQTNKLSQAKVFTAATIYVELEATGKIDTMSTTDRQDEHGGWDQNTYKAYY